MTGEDLDDAQIDAHGRLIDVTMLADPGPPPDRTWTRLELYAMTGPTFGKIVAFSGYRSGNKDPEYNLVVVSDVFTDDAGYWVRVVDYERFSAWKQIPEDQRTPTPTPARAVPAKHVWVMHEKPVER